MLTRCCVHWPGRRSPLPQASPAPSATTNLIFVATAFITGASVSGATMATASMASVTTARVHLLHHRRVRTLQRIARSTFELRFCESSGGAFRRSCPRRFHFGSRSSSSSPRRDRGRRVGTRSGRGGSLFPPRRLRRRIFEFLDQEMPRLFRGDSGVPGVQMRPAL